MRGQTSLHLAAQNGDLGLGAQRRSGLGRRRLSPCAVLPPGLVQVLLDNNCHPNSQEDAAWGWGRDTLTRSASCQETTGWTPLHFAVSKVGPSGFSPEDPRRPGGQAHYSVILQLLQHAETDVNQASSSVLLRCKSCVRVRRLTSSSGLPSLKPAPGS